MMEQLGRYKQYFLRGHSQWFSLLLSLVNFTLIFYNFFFDKLSFIPDQLKSFPAFFVLFMFLYVPISSAVGLADLKRGTFKSENELMYQINPIWRDLKETLTRIERRIENE